jgi:hypothetical protein
VAVLRLALLGYYILTDIYVSAGASPGFWKGGRFLKNPRFSQSFSTILFCVANFHGQFQRFFPKGGSFARYHAISPTVISPTAIVPTAISPTASSPTAISPTSYFHLQPLRLLVISPNRHFTYWFFVNILNIIFNRNKPCGDNGSLVLGGGGGWTKCCSLWQLSEESNFFCACHLLNCEEGQGQWSIAGFWYKVNGARQKKKEKGEPSRVSNPSHQFRSRTCLPLLYERLLERYLCVSIVNRSDTLFM